MTNTTCLPETTLKEYIAGWIPGETQLDIESHLLECSDCSSKLTELENEPDTLLEAIRERRADLPADGDAALRETGKDPLVAYALSRASLLAITPENESQPDPSYQDLVPPRFIGPYEIQRPLGRGGMGAVYLAQHKQLGKQVAIKLLSGRVFRQDPTATRFLREIRTAGQLSHPAIVNATDAGQSDGVHYLVMEYIDGFDLGRITRALGVIDWPTACQITQVVALGLSHAHSQGVVHRDVKPSNIMLSRCGQVKVLDFGLAQSSLWEEASAELTTVGQLMGTLDYMAPEQAEKANGVDYRADLYSLGATLFRLLVGRGPLAVTPNLSPLAKLRLLATSPPPSIRVLRPDLPEGLIALIDQLLQSEPAKRPPSAAHVAQALATWTDGADLEELTHRVDALGDVEQSSIALSRGFQTVETKSPRDVAPKNGRNGNRWERWVLLAMLPLIAAAGVLITLDTNKGQLVIESADANINVKLIQDGKQYDRLHVIPGTQTTRLMAGKYEIVLDSPSDHFTIDKETIEVKRGETIVARVVNRSTNLGQKAEANSDRSETNSAEDLVYENLPLWDWLLKLEKDRSPSSIGDSLVAIEALITPVSRTQIGEKLLTIFATLDPNTVVPSRDPKVASHNVAYHGVGVLRRCFPDVVDYTKRLCEMIETSSDSTATEFLWNSIITRSDGLPLEPLYLLQWSKSKVLSGTGRKHLVEPVASTLRSLMFRDGSDKTWHDAAMHAMESSKDIPLRFYLEFTPTMVLQGGTVLQRPINRTWFKHVANLACETILSTNTSPEDKLMSCILLRLIIIEKEISIELLPENRMSEIEDAIIDQLKTMSSDTSQLAQTVPLPNNYGGPTHPELFAESKPAELSMLTFSNLSMSVSGSANQGCLALEYLKFLKLLPDPISDQERKVLTAMARLLEPEVARLHVFTGNMPFRMPRLTGFGGVVNPNQNRIMWPLESTVMINNRLTSTAQQWMSYFLYVQIADILASRSSNREDLLDMVDGTQRAWIIEAMRKFDFDKDGVVTVNEASLGLEGVIPRAKINAEPDVNQDGKVDDKELLRFVSTYYDEMQQKSRNRAEQAKAPNTGR